MVKKKVVKAAKAMSKVPKDLRNFGRKVFRRKRRRTEDVQEQATEEEPAQSSKPTPSQDPKPEPPKKPEKPDSEKDPKKRPNYQPPEPHPSTPVFRKGQRGNVLRDFKPKVIHGREYSGHALERLSERGLTPIVIENAMKMAKPIADLIPGRLDYYDKINNITVVVCEKTGRVITVFFKKPSSLK